MRNLLLLLSNRSKCRRCEDEKATKDRKMRISTHRLCSGTNATMHKASQLYRPTDIKTIRHRRGGWTKTSVRNWTDEATIYRGMQGNTPHCLRDGHMKSGTTRSLDKSNISGWTCHLPGPVSIHTCRGTVPIIAQAVVQAMLSFQLGPAWATISGLASHAKGRVAWRRGITSRKAALHSNPT